MEKRVAVYNNNTGVIETMSSLLAGEGLKMVAVTGRSTVTRITACTGDPASAAGCGTGWQRLGRRH